MAALDEKNICGLDVAVNDSLGVSRIEPVGDLNTDLQKFRDVDGLAGDTVLESLAFEQLHGDERAAFEFADIVNRADVGMIQR